MAQGALKARLPCPARPDLAWWARAKRCIAGARPTSILMGAPAALSAPEVLGTALGWTVADRDGLVPRAARVGRGREVSAVSSGLRHGPMTLQTVRAPRSRSRALQTHPCRTAPPSCPSPSEPLLLQIRVGRVRVVRGLQSDRGRVRWGQRRLPCPACSGRHCPARAPRAELTRA
jgi:hypothetical protein